VAWKAFRLRGEKVLARVSADGTPLLGADGRVDVLYKPGGKLYRAGGRNLSDDADARILSDDEAAPGDAAPQKADKAGDKAGAKQGARGRINDGAVGADTVEPDAIIAYTDGACTGNPGPMGVGVVLIDPRTKDRRERSEYLGDGTNNIAELVAIQRALELAPDDRGLIVHSDSSYALGLLGLGWKAKANQALVAQLRELAKRRTGLKLVKVAGHAGVPENERADELARLAVDRRMTHDTHVPRTRPG
jgi:ribonuclease HI